MADTPEEIRHALRYARNRVESSDGYVAPLADALGTVITVLESIAGRLPAVIDPPAPAESLAAAADLIRSIEQELATTKNELDDVLDNVRRLAAVRRDWSAPDAVRTFDRVFAELNGRAS